MILKKEMVPKEIHQSKTKPHRHLTQRDGIMTLKKEEEEIHQNKTNP